MAAMELAFFTLDGELLVPTPMACSMWSNNQMHGVALSGALARAAEVEAGEAGLDGMRPARVTVDLFRAATMTPCQVRSEVVRAGRRIALLDTVLTQDGEAVARSSTVLLHPSGPAPGDVWHPAEWPSPPPEEVVPPSEEPRVPYFHSEAGWSQKFGEHQNGSRKASWNTAVPIVAGEDLTPFLAVASMADGASLVTNWGGGGVEHINTDITLTLAREPVGLEIGLVAQDRVEADGVAVGVAAVIDRAGQLGNAVVTSLANTERVVDFEQVEYTDDGQRRTTRI
jgi:hypothetical protein